MCAMIVTKTELVILSMWEWQTSVLLDLLICNIEPPSCYRKPGMKFEVIKQILTTIANLGGVAERGRKGEVIKVIRNYWI